MIQCIHMAIKGNILETISHLYAKYIARYQQEISLLFEIPTLSQPSRQLHVHI